MLVTTIAITAVVAAGVFGWRQLRDEPGGAAAEDITWDQVVLVDRGTGAVTAIDPEDTAVAAQAPATGRVTAVHVEGARVALVQAGQISLTGLDAVEPTVVPIQLGAVVVRLPIDDALWLAVGSSSGGNVLLIDGITGTTYDVGALAGQTAPRYFVDTMRFDAGGRNFAVADAVNGQTIVVHTAVEPPAAAFFADIPIAVADDLVVTSQVVGQQADLALLDPDRRELAKVSGELPVGGVLLGDEVTVVSAEGTISRFGEGDTEAERLGSIAVPAGARIQWVRETAAGSRFVAFGDVFEAVVDLDGRTLFTETFTSQVDHPTIDPGWTCLPVGGGDNYTSIVDLESGESMVDLAGVTVTGIAGNGCTVIGTRSGITEVIGIDGTVQLGLVRAATLAPDGRAVVVQTNAGEVQLVVIDDGTLREPIDLTPLAPANPIVTFRDT
jgi:hypothetical protein